MTIMAATRQLLTSASDRSRREIAVEASRFLPISIDGALGLLRGNMTAVELRAAIEAELAKPRDKQSLTFDRTIPADGPGANPAQLAAAAEDRQWVAELEAGVVEARCSASGPVRVPTSRSRSAVFSSCDRYRYRLDRVVGKGTERIVWIMLNPSTADASADDPTIRRVVGYTKAWGFDVATVVNLFAWRAADPSELPRDPDVAIGPENDLYIRAALDGAKLAICAWGSSGPKQILEQRVVGVRALIEESGVEPCVVSTTKAGAPRHPLYCRKNEQPKPWLGPSVGSQ
jgi:hypothetical protein